MLASHAMPEQPDGRWRFQASHLLVLLLLVFCLLKLGLLASMAVESRYAADEYVQAGHGARVGEFYRDFAPVKTVLYAYFFHFAHRLSESSVELMTVARLQGLALALGMVALVFAITRRLGAGRTLALFAVVVLLSYSNFMERSFRIRSDTLATFFALAGLWVAVGGPRGNDPDGRAQRWRSVVAGLLVGAAFLSTQKAVYHALALGLGYLAAGFVTVRRTESPVRGLGRLLPAVLPAALYSAGWALAVLAYAICFGGLDIGRVLHLVFVAPYRVALPADEAYGGWSAFLYQTLERNLLAYGLCFAGLIVALVRWRRLDPPRALAFTVSLVLSVLVFLHNQPWPYVFVLLLPFLAPWSVETVEWLAPRPGVPRRFAVVALCTAILALSFPRNVSFPSRDNREQNRVVAQAEGLLGPEDRYADGLGMIPTRFRAGEQWWWDAVVQIQMRRWAERGDFRVMEDTFADQPKLWIVNYRIEAVEPLLRAPLSLSYVAVDPNLYLAGTRLVAGEPREIRIAWAGRYGLYERDGRPATGSLRINGQPALPPVDLDAGVYLLELAEPATGERFLLPAGLALFGPLPAEGPPVDLFEGIYH